MKEDKKRQFVKEEMWYVMNIQENNKLLQKSVWIIMKCHVTFFKMQKKVIKVP